MPDSEGRCGRCGWANFSYRNGHEWSATGNRGYRCVGCFSIKPENWREIRNKYQVGDVILEVFDYWEPVVFGKRKGATTKRSGV